MTERLSGENKITGKDLKILSGLVFFPLCERVFTTSKIKASMSIYV
jgi:hypothetical protein